MPTEPRAGHHERQRPSWVPAETCRRAGLAASEVHKVRGVRLWGSHLCMGQWGQIHSSLWSSRQCCPAVLSVHFRFQPMCPTIHYSGVNSRSCITLATFQHSVPQFLDSLLLFENVIWDREKMKLNGIHFLLSRRQWARDGASPNKQRNELKSGHKLFEAGITNTKNVAVSIRTPVSVPSRAKAWDLTGQDG